MSTTFWLTILTTTTVAVQFGIVFCVAAALWTRYKKCK